MQELSIKELEAMVKELEIKLERLRIFYEQYFLGLLKREPLVQLKECVRLLRLADQQQVKNTALRFRLRALTQKLNSYRSYWRRTLRAIEAGTYKRDVARVRRRMAEKGIQLPKLGGTRSVGDFERLIREASEATAGEAPPTASGSGAADDKTASTGPADPPDSAAAPRGPASATKGGSRTPSPSPATASIPDDELQSIYRRFVKAKKMCGESTESVRYATLAQTIERQLPKLRQKHGGRDIEFQVVIRSGRAVLKARPKDPGPRD